MRKVLTALFVLFILTLGGLGYFIFLSDAPYRMVGQMLQKNGYEVTDIKGSLNSGFSVARLVKKDADMEVEADNVVLAHNSLLDAYLNKRVIVKTFDIGKLHVRLLKASKELKSKWKKDDGETGEKPKSRISRARSKLDEFRIETIRIRDVQIETPDLPQPWTLSELTLVQLVAKEGFALEKAVLKSATVDFEVQGLEIDDSGVRHRDKMLGVLHPSPTNSFLKDLTVALTLRTNTSKKLEGEVELCDAKVKAKYSDGTVAMALEGFTPAEYFKSEIPLQGMTGQIDLPNLMFALVAPLPFRGSFTWRDLKFQVPVLPAAPAVVTAPAAAAAALANPMAAILAAGGAPTQPPAVHQRGRDQFFVTIRPQFDFMKKSINTDAPWLELSSLPLRPKRDNIAMMFYGRTYDKLNPEEKTVVEKDERFFSEPAIMQMGRLPASLPGDAQAAPGAAVAAPSSVAPSVQVPAAPAPRAPAASSPKSGSRPSGPTNRVRR